MHGCKLHLAHLCCKNERSALGHGNHRKRRAIPNCLAMAAQGKHSCIRKMGMALPRLEYPVSYQSSFAGECWRWTAAAQVVNVVTNRRQKHVVPEAPRAPENQGVGHVHIKLITKPAFDISEQAVPLAAANFASLIHNSLLSVGEGGTGRKAQ